MVGHMSGDVSQQRLQRHRPRFGVIAGSHKIGRLQLAQNRRHVLPYGDHERQFLVDGTALVGEPCGKRVRVAAEERRAQFGNDPLHAIGIDRLEVRQVAHDLPGGPFAGDRPGVELFLRHAVDGDVKGIGAGEVLIDERCVVHISSFSFLAQKSFGNMLWIACHESLSGMVQALLCANQRRRRRASVAVVAQAVKPSIILDVRYNFSPLFLELAQ